MKSKATQRGNAKDKSGHPCLGYAKYSDGKCWRHTEFKDANKTY